VWVTVTGGPFPDLGGGGASLACAFGDGARRGAVPAQRLSFSAARCVAPSSLTPGVHAVALTLNGGADYRLKITVAFFDLEKRSAV
jgi:hypothetical protein